MMNAHINARQERKVQLTLTESEARTLLYLARRDVIIPRALEQYGHLATADAVRLRSQHHSSLQQPTLSEVTGLLEGLTNTLTPTLQD